MYSSRVGLVSRVGKDFELTKLEARGIDTQGVQVVEMGKQRDSLFITKKMGLGISKQSEE